MKTSCISRMWIRCNPFCGWLPVLNQQHSWISGCS